MFPRKNGEGGMNPNREARWSEWMGAAQGGDGRAYEALLREILPQVRDFIRTYIPHEASSEDVAKTVLLSVHRARHSYRREQPFEPWLYAIVRKVVFDFRRSRGRHPGPEGPNENDPAEIHPVSDKEVEIADPKKRTFLPEPCGVPSSWSVQRLGGGRAVCAGRSSVTESLGSRTVSSGLLELVTGRFRKTLDCLGGAS